MNDFRQARTHMIDSQLRSTGVTDKRILAGMSVIERERFVSPARRVTAYTDNVQWLGKAGSGRFIAPPAIFAKLLQLAKITSDDHVLDIGAATGYSTAVIAGLAASVDGFEPDAELASTAQSNLRELRLANASMVEAIGHSLYDVVFVEGTLQAVPQEYFDALKEGGRLVALVWSGGVSIANVFVRTAKGISASAEFNAALPPLLPVQTPQEFIF